MKGNEAEDFLAKGSCEAVIYRLKIVRRNTNQLSKIGTRKNHKNGEKSG